MARTQLILVLLLIASASGLGFYFSKRTDLSQDNIPVIRAPDKPFKVRPEEPGGMIIPFANNKIFELLKPPQEIPVVERLAPPRRLPVPEDGLENNTIFEPLPDDVPVEDFENTVSEALVQSQDVILNETEEDHAPVIKDALEQEEQPGDVETKATPAEKSLDDVIASALNLSLEGSNDETKDIKRTATPEPEQAEETGMWRVQLSAVRVFSSAQDEWQRFQRLYDPILNDAKLNIEKVDRGPGRIFYRIQASQLTENQAQSICRQIKEKDGDCLVIRP